MKLLREPDVLSHIFPPCDYSLMSLKVVLGIILLKLAKKYHKMDVENEDEVNISAEAVSKSLDDFTGAGFCQRRRQSLTADSHIVAALKIDSCPSGITKSKAKPKSLSDVERFTLCSNRIV